MGAGASTSKSRVKDREVIKTTTSLDSGVNGAKQENDMNLPSVLSDPLLWNIFREWLGGVFADKYLMCWTDIDTVSESSLLCCAGVVCFSSIAELIRVPSATN